MTEIQGENSQTDDSKLESSVLDNIDNEPDYDVQSSDASADNNFTNLDDDFGTILDSEFENSGNNRTQENDFSNLEESTEFSFEFEDPEDNN